MAVATIAATTAGLAYLNARWRLSVDFKHLGSLSKALYEFRQREKRDRINAFYVAEENATNAKVADEVFLLYGDRTWTFRQHYDTVLKYAGWLRTVHHVAQGEKVALNFMNGPEMLFLCTALWSLGATPVLINYNLAGETLVHSIQTSSVRLVVTEEEVATNVLTPETTAKLSSSTVRNGQLPIEMVVLDSGLQTSIEYFKPYRAPDSARSGALPRDACVLISTSGTTGRPKHAIVPWARFVGGSIVSSYQCTMRPVTNKNPDTCYTAIPLYHGSAFLLGFGVAMATPSRFAIGRRLSISSFWPEVKKYNATVIQYVGEALRYLTTAPPQPDGDQNHHVRMALGNGLRPDVWKQFKTRFGVETIMEFYSQTEGTFITWNINRSAYSDGAIGDYGALYSLLISRNLKLVRVDWEREEPWRDPATGFCVEVARGEPGEPISKLDPNEPRASYVGYHNNEKASDSKVLRDVFEKGDVYFRSGDVLKWDPEGRIWFSDRIGDTFRWKSENVSTMEVGGIIGYHPDVLEANVYGVTVPGHEGRAGCAAVLLRASALEEGEGGTTVKPDVLQSLATHSRLSLPKVSVPVFLRVVKEMVVTGNNKTLKHLLRHEGIDPQAVQEAGSGDRLYWLEPQAERYVEFGPEQWASLQAGKARL